MTEPSPTNDTPQDVGANRRERSSAMRDAIDKAKDSRANIFLYGIGTFVIPAAMVTPLMHGDAIDMMNVIGALFGLACIIVGWALPKAEVILRMMEVNLRMTELQKENLELGNKLQREAIQAAADVRHKVAQSTARAAIEQHLQNRQMIDALSDAVDTFKGDAAATIAPAVVQAVVPAVAEAVASVVKDQVTAKKETS